MSQRNCLETLKKWREETNWQIENERRVFFSLFYISIQNWEGQLPNLQDILRKEEIEDILMYAVARANRDVIRFVAETGYKDRPDINKVGYPLLRHTTPVHYADRCYCHHLLEGLFEIYDRFDVNYVDGRGITHSTIAYTNGLAHVIEKYLKLGQGPNCLTQKSVDSLLHESLKNRRVGLVKLLLSKGADPNSAYADGSTPLHIINEHVNLEMMEIFFKTIDDMHKMVEVNAQDKSDNTPLHVALSYHGYGSDLIIQSHFQRTALLLRRGADPNSANAEGLTPLHTICNDRNPHYDMLKYFLDINDEIQQTVHINAQDKKGNTPLHLALQAGHQKMAEYLLERGADPYLVNARGFTALHTICNDRRDRHALAKTFFKICKAKHQLVQVDARDKLGLTPLQLAVANLSWKTVDVLLKRGADLSSFVLPTIDLFCEGLNPDSISNFKSHLASSAIELVELLEKKGYELDRKEALTIMALFAKYGLFQKSEDLEKRWYDDEKFATKAKKIMINSSQSLYDLIQLPPQEAAKKFARSDLLKFSDSKKLRILRKRQREACTAHLCETLSRRFFFSWAGNSLWQLLHYRMPILCCDMISEVLMNEDLRNICLAAEGQSS
uniref:Uncharacterized protein n=1 Tax=Trichogramma kaykai TaxID=54128 RepID=A0ABD2XUI9_9HYME